MEAVEFLLEILKQYGWQAVVVALLTFTLIECLKPLARKFFPKENVRHTLYTALNYAFSFGVSFVLSVILEGVEVFALYGSAIVVVNVLYPIISNVGFFKWVEGLVKGIWEKTSEAGAWKKAVSDLVEIFGVDATMLDTVATKIEEEYLPFLKYGAAIFFSKNKEELILNMKQKLAGFVENDKLQEVAEGLFQKLKDSWKDGKKENILEEDK